MSKSKNTLSNTLGLLLRFSIGFLFSPLVFGADWSEIAMRLSGGSESEKASMIKKLKEIPQLESTLRASLLGDKKFLALDVISALKLSSFLPTLLELSEQDESGFFYHAINSLVTHDNRIKIVQLYKTRLFQATISPSAKIALIDTLARLQASLTESQLKCLLSDSQFEVRSSALHYMRYWILQLGQWDIISLLSLVLQKKTPFQLKLQGLYLISEVPPRYRRSILPFLNHCKSESNLLVKELCSKLQSGHI